MKRVVLLGLATVATLGASVPLDAMAADLPVRAPVAVPAPAPVITDWSGFYIGVVGGYAWATGHFVGTGTGVGQNNDVSMPGWLIGGRIGFDFQLSPMFVLGAVADLSWADLSGQTCVAKFACVPAEDAFAIGKMKWFSTVRARAGLGFGNALVYATGGLAMAGLKGSLTNLTAPGDPTLTDSHTHFGWTVGGGIDYRLWTNLVVGVEYLYVDLGKEHYDFSNSIPGLPITLGADGTLTASIVRGSISYKFGCARC
jgi:outer membrane immunogenic protein